MQSFEDYNLTHGLPYFENHFFLFTEDKYEDIKSVLDSRSPRTREAIFLVIDTLQEAFFENTEDNQTQIE